MEEINLESIFAFEIFKYIYIWNNLIVLSLDKIFLILWVNIFTRNGFDLHDFAVIVNICLWKGCIFASYSVSLFMALVIDDLVTSYWYLLKEIHTCNSYAMSWFISKSCKCNWRGDFFALKSSSVWTEFWRTFALLTAHPPNSIEELSYSLGFSTFDIKTDAWLPTPELSSNQDWGGG